MKIYSLCVFLIFVWSCQSYKGVNSKGTYLKWIRGVTPSDIQSNTRKIFVREYQFVIERFKKSASTIYYETSWKNVELTPDEKENGLVNVRVRFKIRSREIRRGPVNNYAVYNLKLIAEVEAYDGSSWVPIVITSQRQDYLEHIYDEYKLEFKTGVIKFNP